MEVSPYKRSQPNKTALAVLVSASVLSPVSSRVVSLTADQKQILTFVVSVLLFLQGVVFLLIHHVIITIGRPNIPVTTVCGTNGRTYKNKEELRLAQKEEADLQLLYQGPCMRPLQESVLQNLEPYQRDGPIHDYHLKVSLPGVEMEYLGSRPEILEKRTPDLEDSTRKLRGGLGSIRVHDPSLRIYNQPSYQPSLQSFYQPYAAHREPYYTSHKPVYQPYYNKLYKSPYQQKHSSVFKTNYPVHNQLSNPYHYRHRPKKYIHKRIVSYNPLHNSEFLLHKYDLKHAKNCLKENGNRQDICKGDNLHDNKINEVKTENIGEGNSQDVTKYIEETETNYDEYNSGDNVGDSWEVFSNGFDPFVSHLILVNNDQNMHYNSNESILSRAHDKFGDDHNRGMYSKTFEEVLDPFYRPPKATPIYFKDNALNNLDPYPLPISFSPYNLPARVLLIPNLHLGDKDNLLFKPIPDSLASDLFALTESVLPDVNGNLPERQESTHSSSASNSNVALEPSSSKDGNVPSQSTRLEGNLPASILSELENYPLSQFLPTGFKDNSVSNSIHSNLNESEGDSTDTILILLGGLPNYLENNTAGSRDFPLNSLVSGILQGLEINTKSSPSLNSSSEIPDLQDKRNSTQTPFNFAAGGIPVSLKDNTRGTTDFFLNRPSGEVLFVKESTTDSSGFSLKPSTGEVVGIVSNIVFNADSSQDSPTGDEDNREGDTDSSVKHPFDTIFYDSENNIKLITDSFANSPTGDVVSSLEDNSPSVTIISDLKDNIKFITDSSQTPSTGDVITGLIDNSENDKDLSVNPPSASILSGLVDNTEFITDQSLNIPAGYTPPRLSNTGGSDNPYINYHPYKNLPGLQDGNESSEDPTLNNYTEDVLFGLEDDVKESINSSLDPFRNKSHYTKDDKLESIDSPTEYVGGSLTDKLENMHLSSSEYTIYPLESNTESSTHPFFSPILEDVLFGSENDSRGGRDRDLTLNRPHKDVISGSQDDVGRIKDASLHSSPEDALLGLLDDANKSINTSISPKSEYKTPDIEDHPEDLLHSPPYNLFEQTPSNFDYSFNAIEDNSENKIGINGEGQSYLNSDLSDEHPDYYLIDDDFLTSVIGTGIDLESSLTDEDLEDIDAENTRNSVEKGMQSNPVNSVLVDQMFNPKGSIGWNGKKKKKLGRVWLVPETVISVDSYEIIGEGSSYEHIFRDSVENTEESKPDYTDITTKDLEQYTSNDVSSLEEDNLSSHNNEHEHLGKVGYDESCNIENWFKK